MVVADAIFEPRRGSGRLNAADQTLGDQHGEGVVDRLQRDGADLTLDDPGDAVGADVRPAGDRPHHGEPLGGDVDAALAEQRSRVGGHRHRIVQILE